MQKKIIALAVAGLMSGAAFAQSNVTISGVVDMGYSYRSENVNSAISSRKGIDTGMQSGNRIQFAGVEDLGGGLKAGFVLEQGFAVDTGAFGANGAAAGVGFGRQAYMYMSGKFGRVAFGRQYTPQFFVAAASDPFGLGTVGQAANFYAFSPAPRADNMATYASPSFGGFGIVVGYTANVNNNEAAGSANTNTRIYAISPTYKNGPILAGFNYQNARLDGAGFASKAWDLGVSYNLGVAKLSVLVGRDTDLNAAGQDRAKWLLGVHAPVGAGALMASYGKVKTETGSTVDNKANQWAFGYQHNLSKRTNAYVAYANIDNKVGTAFSVGDGSNAGGGYESGFNIGLRHMF